MRCQLGSSASMEPELWGPGQRRAVLKFCRSTEERASGSEPGRGEAGRGDRGLTGRHCCRVHVRELVLLAAMCCCSLAATCMHCQLLGWCCYLLFAWACADAVTRRGCRGAGRGHQLELEVRSGISEAGSWPGSGGSGRERRSPWASRRPGGGRGRRKPEVAVAGASGGCSTRGSIGRYWQHRSWTLASRKLSSAKPDIPADGRAAGASVAAGQRRARWCCRWCARVMADVGSAQASRTPSALVVKLAEARRGGRAGHEGEAGQGCWWQAGRSKSVQPEMELMALAGRTRRSAAQARCGAAAARWRDGLGGSRSGRSWTPEPDAGARCGGKAFLARAGGCSDEPADGGARES